MGAMEARAVATAEERERLDALKDFSQATRRFCGTYDDLLAAYPHRWIAVNRDGEVLASHQDRQSVVAAGEAAGWRKSRLAVKYLDPNPAVTILLSAVDSILPALRRSYRPR